jgi:hypothetical protein
MKKSDGKCQCSKPRGVPKRGGGGWRLAVKLPDFFI